MNIGISTIVASLIKSIVSFLAFTDVSILDVKVSKEISKDEKINKVIMRVSSKATAFFSLSIIIMSICWIYCGSFCSVFKNTQIYLFLNAAISFGGVIILPFLYYLISNSSYRLCGNRGNRGNTNRSSLFSFSTNPAVFIHNGDELFRCIAKFSATKITKKTTCAVLNNFFYSNSTAIPHRFAQAFPQTSHKPPPGSAQPDHEAEARFLGGK